MSVRFLPFISTSSPTTDFYPLSLHDALPILAALVAAGSLQLRDRHVSRTRLTYAPLALGARSEEHTSELQSLRHLVCRLLLEKKNRQATRYPIQPTVHASEHRLRLPQPAGHA